MSVGGWQQDGCTEEQYNFLRELVEKETGIVLGERKKQMINRRVVSRLRELKLGSMEDYCNLLKSGQADEILTFVNLITTNVTHFFREQHHFDFLQSQAIKEAMERNASTRTIKVWSAGCSSGQEPYSIAYTLKSAVPNPSQWDLKILATDLDTSILEKAKQAEYGSDGLKGMEAGMIGSIFNQRNGRFIIKDMYRNMVTFKKLNLMDEVWPMKGPFDVIFCRNVMIYFSPEKRVELVKKYLNLLANGGYLIIGHSEKIDPDKVGISYVKGTIYQKVCS